MTPSDSRIPVAVLGATGAVGQRMVRLLANHPWFRVAIVTGSSRSTGRPYREAANWLQDAPLPDSIAGLTVVDNERVDGVPLAFSALDSAVAGDAEEALARAGVLVVSNARNHRMDPRVPLLVPEVNADHLALLDEQPWPGGGGIVTNPNCAAIGVVLALAPLHRAAKIRALNVTTLQAVSGAGFPGVSSLAIQDNVIPFISGEEEKLETEPAKILGALDGGRIVPADFPVSAHCTRVPVSDGHTATISVGFERTMDPDEAAELLAAFRGVPQELELPSAPRAPIHVVNDEAGPQPRLHRNLEGGMAVSVGRIRRCPVQHLRFTVLSHNTVRGAAGGSVLCAELAVAKGRLTGVAHPDAGRC